MKKENKKEDDELCIYFKNGECEGECDWGPCPYDLDLEAQE